ncbi:MAG TPA: MBL fold metallo-hydrolase [Acetobacteraceae bacterium]|jgi:glyoxylase-like metal-dependent hydrolase (beta-lactamase superfamily II)|nr:MBL fold metallo-hydrolase [Acetobacteraceae bacterium]
MTDAVRLNRRGLLAGTAAAIGAAALPGGSRASVPLSGKQAPGFYRVKLGEYEVTILNDGARTFPLPDTFVSNVSKDKALKAASDAFMSAGKVTVPFNPTLINTGSKLVLIDTGNGPSPDGAVGHLFPNLAAAGVKPEDIDVVVISHLHPDHINGLRTPSGAIAFPNAQIIAPEPEWAFWMSDENMAKASDTMTKNYFANTRKILTGMEDRVARYAWGKEVAPGITAMATPGHTPGHTSFAVASGNSRMMVQSDVTNIPEFFLLNPNWHVAYDHDPELAQKTRHKFYDMAASEKMLVAGYHFSFPSAGHVEKNGTGYRLVPVAWSAVL